MSGTAGIPAPSGRRGRQCSRMSSSGGVFAILNLLTGSVTLIPPARAGAVLVIERPAPVLVWPPSAAALVWPPSAAALVWPPSAAGFTAAAA
jgi:hypothetical protein